MSALLKGSLALVIQRQSFNTYSSPLSVDLMQCSGHISCVEDFCDLKHKNPAVGQLNCCPSGWLIFPDLNIKSTHPQTWFVLNYLKDSFLD